MYHIGGQLVSAAEVVKFASQALPMPELIQGDEDPPQDRLVWRELLVQQYSEEHGPLTIQIARFPDESGQPLEVT